MNRYLVDWKCNDLDSLTTSDLYGMQAVGVSSVTGEGMQDFLAAVQEARQEYLDDYRPELERLAKERDAKRETSKKEQLARLMKDMKVGSKSSLSQSSTTTRKSARSTEDLSRPIDEEYEGDGQIIEPVSHQLPHQRPILLQGGRPLPARMIVSRRSACFPTCASAWRCLDV